MKAINKLVTLGVTLLVAILATSCLEANLPAIDTYDGKTIESINGVYHRYYGTADIPASGEKEVKQHQLTIVKGSEKKDAEAGTYTFDVQVPTNLPKDQIGKVKADNLVVILNISTAAIIEPVEDSAPLGVPADWSKPNKYKITAANGDTQIWTVSLRLIQ